MAFIPRINYSAHFHEDFKRLYAKLGTDRDCLSELLKIYSVQYPNLTQDKIKQYRVKRLEEFRDAREVFLKKISEESARDDMEAVIEAGSLNSQLAARLINHQKRILATLDKIEPSDENDKLIEGYTAKAMALQKEINDITGLNTAKALKDFRTRLVDRKMVEESNDLPKFIESLEGGSFGEVESEVPKIESEEDEV